MPSRECVVLALPATCAVPPEDGAADAARSVKGDGGWACELSVRGCIPAAATALVAAGARKLVTTAGGRRPIGESPTTAAKYGVDDSRSQRLICSPGRCESASSSCSDPSVIERKRSPAV